MLGDDPHATCKPKIRPPTQPAFNRLDAWHDGSLDEAPVTRSTKPPIARENLHHYDLCAWCLMHVLIIDSMCVLVAQLFMFAGM